MQTHLQTQHLFFLMIKSSLNKLKIMCKYVMLDEILVKPEEIRVVSTSYVCREGKDVPV